LVELSVLSLEDLVVYLEEEEEDIIITTIIINLHQKNKLLLQKVLFQEWQIK